MLHHKAAEHSLRKDVSNLFPIHMFPDAHYQLLCMRRTMKRTCHPFSFVCVCVFLLLLISCNMLCHVCIIISETKIQRYQQYKKNIIPDSLVIDTQRYWKALSQLFKCLKCFCAKFEKQRWEYCNCLFIFLFLYCIVWLVLKSETSHIVYFRMIALFS